MQFKVSSTCSHSNLIRACSAGSATFPAVISILIGLFFVGTLYDLTRYVSAVNAIEQGARAAAKCLTSTDGIGNASSSGDSCISLDAAAAGSEEITWYGFEVEDIPTDRQATFAPFATFSASMTQERYGVEAAGFEITSAPLSVELETTTLPVKRFDATLYENRYARGVLSYALDDTASYLVPKPFPVFNEGFERAFQNASAANLESLVARYLAHRPEMQDSFTSQKSFRELRAGGSEVIIESDTLEIPTLSAEIEGCQPGLDCTSVFSASSADPTITNAATDPAFLKNYVPLAVKVFSLFRRTTPSGEGEIRYARRVKNPGDDKWGLELIVTTPDGTSNIFYPSGSPTQGYYCLGGTSALAVAGEPKFLNMWLRGPDGSNGGTSASCPDSNRPGDWSASDHSGLLVQRGSSVKLRAYLYADKTSSSADALKYAGEVLFMIDYDSLEAQDVTTTTSHTTTCPEQRLLPSVPLSDIFNDDTCGLPENSHSATVKSLTDSRTEVSCEQDGAFVRKNTSVFSALCNNSRPENLGELLDDAYAHCPADSFALIEHEQFETTVPRASCSMGTNDTLTVSCLDENGSGVESVLRTQADYGPVSATCPGTFSIPAVSSLNIAANGPSLHEVSPYSFAADFRMKVLAASTGTTEFGCSSPGAGYSATAVTKRFGFDDGNHLTRWKRADGQISEASELVPAELPADGHSCFQARLLSSQEVALAEDSFFEVESQLGSYPLATSLVAESLTSAWSFDGQCSSTANCSDAYDYPSEDTYVRAHARAQVSEAMTTASPDSPDSFLYQLNYQVSDPIMRFVGLRGDLADDTFSSCKPHLLECVVDQSETPRTERIVLAQGPLTDYSGEPESCKNGTHTACYSELSDLANFDFGPLDLNVSPETAKLRAESVLRRLIPVSTTGEECEGPGCLNVSISTDTLPEAGVEVTYNFPLSFPLNQIFQSEHLVLTHQKTEVMELAVAAMQPVGEES